MLCEQEQLYQKGQSKASAPQTLSQLSRNINPSVVHIFME